MSAETPARNIQWKRGRFPGDWEAYLNGHKVCETSVCEGTPTGYWGRYRGWVAKKLTGASTGKHIDDSLRSFKEIVQYHAERLPADHEFLVTEGTDLKTRRDDL
jgi:hypothetical protein